MWGQDLGLVGLEVLPGSGGGRIVQSGCILVLCNK